MDKNDILDEIRRAAEETGGNPPGSARFAKLTGIREAHWSKYWLRWGDALVEAGFSPNKFVEPYSDEFLLEKLAGLVKELRHFPIVREIKMKARHERGFPAEHAFRRLSAKYELATKLIVFCNGKPEYREVIQLCEPYTSVHPQPTGLKDTPADAQAAAHGHLPMSKSARVVGEVYLLKSGRYYKVGRTNSVGRREYELTIQLPEKPKFIHAIKTDDPPGIEAYWHRRFTDRRKNGEWFELTTDDVAAFKMRKFM